MDGDVEGDADADSDADVDSHGGDGDVEEGPGHVTYRLADGHIFRIEAREGAFAEDLSRGLDGLSAGTDEWVSSSRDGEWLLAGTERFGCDGWACLVLVSRDLTVAEVVRDDAGEPLHAGPSAVAPGATRVVYPVSEGGRFDLWSVSRLGESWGPPVLLTGGSPYPYNESPRFDAVGDRVVFHCGTTPYGQEGTALCEVGADGEGLGVLLRPEDRPAGGPDGSLRSPDYAPDGSVVFEGDWNGEQVWRLPAGGAAPGVVGGSFSNDNSPCVLPDGRIVSLWLGRPGSTGGHELKVMTPDGREHFMLLVDQDVADIGIGCSR